MSTVHTVEERMNNLFGKPTDLPTSDELVASGALVDATGLYAAGNASDPDRQARLLGERTVFSLTRIPNTPRATIPRHTNATTYPAIDNGRLTLTFRLAYE